MNAPPNLAIATLLWRPDVASYCMMVVAKATFTLAPDELVLAEDGEPINETDSHWNDDPGRSLSSVTDLAPAKPRADVVLVGHAFAPGGRPVRSLVARLVVAGIDKAIEVWVDRSVAPDGSVYEGAPFARMPLRYERAAGGPGTWNPVGMAKGARDAYGRAALPNLQPRGFLSMGGRMPEPVGFGPIAASWPPRAAKLGQHASAFSPERWSEAPLPEGFDLSHFNVAPPDQQPEAIPEHAPLRLENLHREHAVLSTRLPGLRPRARFERHGATHEVPMRADLLWIDTDRGICTLTWRGQIPLESEAERPAIQLALEAVPAPLAPPPALDGAPPAAPASVRSEQTRSIDLSGAALPGDVGLPFQGQARRKATLPFVASAPAPPPAPAPSLPLEGRLADPPSWADAPLSSRSAPLPERPPAPEPVAFAERTPPPIASPWAGGAIAPASAVSAPVPLPVPALGLGAAPRSESAPSPWAAAATPEPPPPAFGVVDASNAAAERRPGGASAGEAGASFRGDALELLWFDADIAIRMRRRADWKKILDELEQGPPDPEVDQSSLAEDAAEVEDRREVFEVMARGEPCDESGVDRALAAAVRSDGRFAPQLLLLAGEVRFDFDEVESLKAAIAAATPFAGTEGDLKSAIDTGAAFLGAPGGVTSPEVASALTTNIREAFVKASRAVPATYLEDQSERALLERRAYQKRPVFGAPHLRGVFFFPGSTTGVPTYFPEPVAKKLPLFRRLRVRLLAEVHFQEDQYESHPTSLRAAAVARVIAPRAS